MFVKYMAAWIFVIGLALVMSGGAMLHVGTDRYHTAELYYDATEKRVQDAENALRDMKNTCERWLREDAVFGLPALNSGDIAASLDDTHPGSTIKYAQ